jgi:hypothetical protein
MAGTSSSILLCINAQSTLKKASIITQWMQQDSIYEAIFEMK